MHNGHMFFHAGRNKNITFVTGESGSIYFGNFDIQNLPTIVICIFIICFLSFL